MNPHYISISMTLMLQFNIVRFNLRFKLNFISLNPVKSGNTLRYVIVNSNLLSLVDVYGSMLVLV